MGFLNLLFPVNCLECGKSGGYICDNCLKEVDLICRLNPTTKTFTIFNYEGVIRRAIIALKYKFAFDIANELAQVCAHKLKTSDYRLMSSACLVPIPLHKTRERWRGFNQSALVGKAISNQMGWNYEPDLLVREVASKPQVGLPKSERVRNMRGKFAVNKQFVIPTEVEGSLPVYIIFDDVLTTGSTIGEAMSVLKKACPERSRRVIGLTIAK